MKKGLLIVLSGPSGAGKGTVLKELSEIEEFALSISTTSRVPREGEIEGVNYFFKSKEEFEQLIKEEAFFEYAMFNGNYYGTPKEYVFEQINMGKNVMLEIEVQGALQVKSIAPEAILIFMMPETAKELESRLVGRNTETKEQIQGRINTAYKEVELLNCYDYVVINDKVEETVKDLKAIIDCEKDKAIKNNILISKFKGE